jgi:hypothetical protein
VTIKIKGLGFINSISNTQIYEGSISEGESMLLTSVGTEEEGHDDQSNHALDCLGSGREHLRELWGFVSECKYVYIVLKCEGIG